MTKDNSSQEPKPEIFISYAWGEEGEEREEIVNQLQSIFEQHNLSIIRDKVDGVNYRGSIKDFMKRIGKGNMVLVVISDKYLKSKHCMFELLEIEKQGDFRSRIFPIVLPDAKIYDAIDILDYTDYWDEKSAKLQARIKQAKSNANNVRVHAELDLYVAIRAAFDRLADVISDMNTLSVQLHKNSNFAEIIKAIEDKIKEDQLKKKVVSDASNLSVESSFQNFADHYKHFCDRFTQEEGFISYLEEYSSEMFQFYIIHGESKQGHDGLIKRFALQRLGVEPESIHKVLLTEATSENRYRNKIVIKLFEKVKGERVNRPLDQLHVGYLAELVKKEQQHKCVINFKVQSSYWKDFTPNLLNWFATEYCNEAQLPENSPVFYFFLSVVYAEDTQESTGIFGKLLGKKDRKTTIREQFRKLRSGKPLEELQPVEKQHVLDWFEEYVSVNDTVREKLYKAFFNDQKALFMEDVEATLEDFINKYNLKDESLKEYGIKF